MSEMPKAYEPQQYEAEIYRRWEASGLFNPDVSIAKGFTTPDAPPFSIVLPPPNVTGTLHMGHAAMLAIEDMMVRYHRMKGDRTLWLPGTDHAAVATESKVEGLLIKDEGFTKPKEELGREAFLERVKQFAQDSHDTIINQAKKMGSSLDWSREAYTLDEARNHAVRTVFKQMYEDGLIYRGYRVINWSVKGQSTCSDDELVYVERPAKLYYFKYSPDFPITIATTRPETKLGDTAVAVHPDGKWKKFIGQEFTVKNFVGVSLAIKIIGDDGVDDAFGTGALGVTTAHSATDFDMYLRQKALGNDIGLIQVIGEDGKMTNNAGPLCAGLSVEAARAKVVEWLQAEGLLEKEEDTVQNAGTSDRFKDVVEPLPKTQWFVDVNKKTAGRGRFAGQQVSLKEMMQAVVRDGAVEIVPDRFNKTYFHWIDNLRDWCISRQIWFGHQIPVWYRGNEIFVGTEAPVGDDWTQDSDTLDTWFSSGLWTFSTLGWPTTTVDFIRHGEAENNVAQTVSDDMDRYHLTERGRGQIVELAEQLKNKGIAAIIASPVLRTRETAEILSDKLGLPITWDERLREVGVGDLQDHTEADLQEARERADWTVQTPYGLESYVSLRSRTHRAMKDILQTYRGQHVAIVSHGDTLSVLKQFGTDAYTNEIGRPQGRATVDTRHFDSDGRQNSDLSVYHPTGVLETGYDILFFWVARMILMTTYTLGDVPFKTVYLHGLVRDEQGRKMSKSLGNIIDPLDMIAKYGTDATRLSLLLGNTPGNDMKLSEEKIAGFRNFTNKLWNISRFVISNLPEGMAVSGEVPMAKTLADRWILARLNETIAVATENIEKYNFSYAGEVLRDFTWTDFADWYLEIAKIEGDKSDILRYVLANILKLWHPYTPFVTEAIWTQLHGEVDLIMVAKWPSVGEVSPVVDFTLIQNIIVGIRAVRSENKLEPAKLVKVAISAGDKTSVLTDNLAVLKGLARAEAIEIASVVGKPATAVGFVEAGVDVFVDLAGLVDKDKERARLTKEIATVAPYLESLNRKLSNQEFVQNAPPAVIEIERKKLADAEAKLTALTTQLSNL